MHSPIQALRTIRLEIVLVAAFALLAGASLLRSQSPAADPSRIATVDLEKVFNSLTQYTAMQERVKGVGLELEKQVKEAESKVRELQADLESFRDGSKEQQEALARLQSAVGELRAVQQFVTGKLEFEKARVLRDTYLAIKDGVRRFAETNGYDYILLDDSVVEMDPANATRTMQQISARRFLYTKPSHDVTAQLIGMMNEEWKRNNGG